MTKENTIDKQFLVVVDVGPLVMTEDKTKAINSLKMARVKGHKGYVQEITASKDRIKEIGKNIFKRKITTDQRKEILNIRAKIIREYIDFRDANDYTDDYVWKKIAKKNNLVGFTNLDDFSQWTLDIREFSPYDNPKLTLDDGTTDGKIN